MYCEVHLQGPQSKLCIFSAASNLPGPEGKFRIHLGVAPKRHLRESHLKSDNPKNPVSWSRDDFRCPFYPQKYIHRLGSSFLLFLKLKYSGGIGKCIKDEIESGISRVAFQLNMLQTLKQIYSFIFGYYA